MYVVLVALVLVVLTSILQAYAVIVEAPFALVMSVLLFIICWFLELVGGTLIVVYGVEESDVLTNSLDKVFFRLIYQMDNDDRTRRILKIVQEYVSNANRILCIFPTIHPHLFKNTRRN